MYGGLSISWPKWFWAHFASDYTNGKKISVLPLLCYRFKNFFIAKRGSNLSK